MKYQLYIFDLDGTFYDIEDLISFNFNQEAQFLMDSLKIDKDTAEDMLISHGIYPDVRPDAKSCTEFFQQIGLDLKAWNTIRSKDFPVHLIKKENSLNQKMLDRFRSEGVLALVSNNTSENIRKIFSHLDIDPAVFSCIFSKDSQNAVSSDKTGAYRKTLENLHIDAENTLAIGDRYNIDVLPLIRLGGSGIVVSGPRGVADYLSGKNSENYHIYHSMHIG